MALDLAAHVRDNTARFRDVLLGADPGTPAPTCPDWTAADLLWHLTEVQWFWATIVRDRLSDPDVAEAAAPARPDSMQATAELLDEGTTALLSALADADDAEPVWTWTPDHSVGFVRRMQAHEAAMHRLDAELLAGADTGLDPALATDGVDLVLRYCFGWRPDWSTVTPGPVGQVGGVLVQVASWGGHSPDTGKTYTAEPLLGVVEEGAPEFTVDGDPVVLDRWLWSRGPADGLTVDGDRGAYEAFAAVVAKGVQ
jgi:uncharacterized protein (TIGR03083 family)